MALRRIAASIARVDIDDVSTTYVRYLVALLVGLALIAAFPVFTLVLPRLLLGHKGYCVFHERVVLSGDRLRATRLRQSEKHLGSG